MIDSIIKELTGKDIAILGFGKEGKSSYDFIRKHSNMHLTIIDKNNILTSNPGLKEDPNIDIIFGDNYLSGLEKYDLVLKGPGVITKDIDTSNINFSSQLELLLKYNKQNTIGITATKGKSTTCTLTYEVIKACGKKVLLLGNIGTPIFEAIEDMDEDTLVVVEMAALQLEFVDVSPHIGCIINLFEDHLDHAGTVEHYHANKLNMFKHQTRDDYMIYSCDLEPLPSYVSKNGYKGKPYKISLDKNTDTDTLSVVDNYVIFNNEKLYNTLDHRYLVGTHNVRNIMFVLAISHILGLDLNQVIHTINEFHGLEHRIEYVGKYHDIIYYNDSIATVPAATINAIESLGSVDTLIFGGMDRGIDYDELVDYLNKGTVRNLLGMPSTGYKIIDLITNDKVNKYKVETLEEATKLAREITGKDKICLLSPAASSYEYFKNFEEKGRAFKSLVKMD